MRKLSILLITIMMIIWIGPLFEYRAESKENSNEVYVVTKKCPKAYYDYVDNNIDRFLTMVEMENNELNGIAIIGRPFSFCNYDSDVFYFPIIYNGEIRYTFRVFPNDDGVHEGILGKAYVTELNETLLESRRENPLIFLQENESVVTYFRNIRKEIIKYPKGTINSKTYRSVKDIENMISDTLSEYEVVNVYEKIFESEITFAKSISTNSHIIRDGDIPQYKVLGNLGSIIETQGSQSWCAAFATAWIVRFCFVGSGDTTTAYSVMCSQYTNPTSNDSIGEAEVLEYAHLRGLWPTYYTGTLTNSALINQIVNNCPVYLRMQRTDNNNVKHYHAIVLRGYNNYSNTWSVWNPWDNFYDSFAMGGVYVPASNTSRTYYYYQTIYNW